jgi:hypothetical protein
MVEAMRIDQASNLLVGTSSNDGQSIGTGSEDGVVLTGESQYIQRGDNANLWLSKPSGATNSEYIKFYNNSASVGNIGTASGDLNINGPAGHSGIRFQASSILPRYDGADTDGTMDIGYNDGTATHRWRDLYLSGGVYLGGTGAAHKLDDYEEVNFTATLRGSTEPSTLLTVTAFATKIGRVVQYSIGFENINTTGYSGYVTITGLPFTNNGGRAMGNLVAYQGLTYSGTDPFSVIGVNSTTLEAFSISSNSTWAQSHHDPGNGSYFWLTGTYMTTA